MVKVDFLMQLWKWNCSAILWLLASNPAVANIVADPTLPTNTTVSNSGNVRVIEGGTQRGTNLFHSFQEFSFSINTANITGDTAFFNNDAAVRNIFARVTGGSISNIDGVIRANGLANLFLINPSGIIFGPNASLNVGGSFIASTANSIKFADGQEFSATNPTPNPLLTVSIPVGLDFNSNGGRIVNQSQANLNGEVTDAEPPNPIGLKAPIGKTLALIGGNVAIEGGNLTTTAGRIELASIGTGLVTLTEIEKGYAFDYSGVQDFGDINVSQFAIIYGSGNDGSEIALQGENVNLSDSSLVFINSFGEGRQDNLSVNARNLTVDGGAFLATFAFGEGDAGNIQVKASESIELAGTTPDGVTPSSIASQVLESATGNAGNLIIETKKLLIRDGATLEYSTFGFGQAGNINIKASDIIELSGVSQDGQIASGIFAISAQAITENLGDSGTLAIETQKLTVTGGAQIATTVNNSGNGGNITIQASDEILVSGASSQANASPFDNNRSGIFVGADLAATGNVGSLNIRTRLLTVENGARISASNFGAGQLGGNANLDLKQLVVKNGGEIRAASFGEGPGGTLNIQASDSVEVVGVGNIGGENVVSNLSTQAQASGNAGNLIINSLSLSVRDGAELTVSSNGSGQAGNLELTARRVFLDNQGKLIAETASGNGGNITLILDEALILRRNSLISTTVGNNQFGGDGGNININSPFIVAVPKENSDIRADAFTGKGGEVSITANGIFGIIRQKVPTEKSDITASSELGVSGEVSINTPDIDPSRGLTELPSNLVDASQQIASGCTPRGRQTASRFIATGRGGLPQSPNEPLRGRAVITGWVDLPAPATAITDKLSTASMTKSTDPIVEAQGWIVDANGNIMLVAQSVPSSFIPSAMSCGQ